MNMLSIGSPEISVVVTIVDGGDVLRKCLSELAAQAGSDQVEIIIPYDHMSPEVAGMKSQFPGFNFLDLGVIEGGIIPQNALEYHQLWDIRRAEGIKKARGRFIGLLHDRGIPARNWVATMVEMHQEFSVAAIGGCVDNGYDTSWHWAVHFFDFGRYMAPHKTAETEFLSVTNLCYAAADLCELEHLYQHRFHEVSVHDHLMASGKKLILSDRPRTTEIRPRVRTTDLALEWFFWGRKYAAICSKSISNWQRFCRVLVSPLVPFVLFARALRVQLKKRVYLRYFWPASPLLFLVVLMWAIGEMVGYCRGPKPDEE